MMKALDYSNCPGKCLWSRYHADLLQMESQQTFMGFEVKYRNIGSVRETILQASAADGISILKERSSILTWRLHNDLAIEVLDYGTKEVMANCRVICD